VQALPTHAACALATLVEQAFEHEPQSLTSVVSLTHVLPQSVGVAAGQPDTQVEPLQTGVPPVQASPQVLQLLLSLAVSTHAPLQSVYPALQASVHTLLRQTACALATLVEQTFPHDPQSAASLVVSTQEPAHRVGADARQPDVHEYVPPDAEHTGVAPVQALPHDPQFCAVVRGTHAPLQRV
jgi:hypothetical protein